MTNDEWDDLVRRRVEQAKSDPRGYRLRVWAWALGGYAALLATLGLALASVVAIVVAIVADGAPILLVKLAIPAIALAVIIVRSLALRPPPPDGIELQRADAPALFDTIDELRAELHTPRVHHVLIDGDLNASIRQVPRLGLFGPQVNYLTVGLGFLQALSPAELESVLAHELAHISRSHGRFGSWIYRLRNSWGGVAHELSERGFYGAGLARRFLGWYVPRLQACSLALVREHEHEADRAAADAVGAHNAACALVRAAALAPAAGRYWNDIYRRAIDEPAPPRGPFTDLQHALREPPGADGERAVQQALATPTDTADTHPSIAERLAALGIVPATLDVSGVLVAPPAIAADVLLGSASHARIAGRLSNDWYAAVQEGWSRRHAEAVQERADLGRLDERAAAGTLDAPSARSRALLIEELRDEDAALQGWRDVLALDDSDARANVAVGARLLAHGDDAGLAHLDRAIDASPIAAVRAADIGYDYLAGGGRHEDAARYRARRNRELEVLDAAAAERQGIGRLDELEHHGLEPATIEEIRAALAKVDGLAHTYLARKRVMHLPGEAPLYVLGVERVSKLWRLESSDDDARLVRRVVDAAPVPGEFLVISLAKPNRWLGRRLQRLDGARL